MPNQNPTPEQIVIGVLLLCGMLILQFVISFGVVAWVTSTEAWYDKVDLHKLHGVNGFVATCEDEKPEDISTCDDCDFDDLPPTQICYYKYRIYKDINPIG